MEADTSLDTAATPVVSVIIPAFNASATIARQLEALSRQKVAAVWEVIVCDNGSTDDTARVARAWENRLPLRVIDASARRGPAAARNAGAAAARSPLLVFCDADDAVAEEWLAELLPVLARNHVVVTSARVASTFSTRARPLYDIVTTLRMPFLPELPFGSSSRLAVSAEAFHAVGGFDESLRTGEDVDLSWRLQLTGYPLSECTRALIDHHQRNGFAATVRQFAGYQAGRQRIQHRYAQVIAEFTKARGGPPGADADWESGVVSSSEPAPTTHPSSRLGRIASYARDATERREYIRRALRSARLRTARSLGLALGRLSTRVDESQPQIPGALARDYLDRERPFDARSV
ncbi:glycosyltransferase involved in cell wall biosynthesis [Microbacterium terrae]|uniref:4,4'-diaponeurosporenoate glycosyltransferase n=1 Tax=Microbacterium terrae TaxID=69369 RepID=A0A0M2HER6_9MICO|nr:glycosyltransferase family A protein [Microbacterium terrae]KJL42728.1 putative glycosyltransferase EpsE [Microbacterium terrae]MBP1078559.1 glycosyltransferase involved in cell wall biosynthesis [Microbacterium terrae]GLJ97959.1 hypothetical protein GCM10017594_11560 [Microbacterium terrae]